MCDVAAVCDRRSRTVTSLLCTRRTGTQLAADVSRPVTARLLKTSSAGNARQKTAALLRRQPFVHSLGIYLIPGTGNGPLKCCGGGGGGGGLGNTRRADSLEYESAHLGQSRAQEFHMTAMCPSVTYADLLCLLSKSLFVLLSSPKSFSDSSIPDRSPVSLQFRTLPLS
jgi:hypothetical protein